MLRLVGQAIVVFGLGGPVVHDGCFDGGVVLIIEDGRSWYSGTAVFVSSQCYFVFIYIGLAGITFWDLGGAVFLVRFVRFRG